MEIAYNKSYCKFGINSSEVSPQEITDELNILPTFASSKEDLIESKNGNYAKKRSYNIWSITSEMLISKERDISFHIAYLQKQLDPKIDILKKYKKDPRFNLIFSTWIEIGDNVGGFSLDEDELFFINTISQRYDCFFLLNESLFKSL